MINNKFPLNGTEKQIINSILYNEIIYTKLYYIEIDFLKGLLEKNSLNRMTIDLVL